MDPGTVNARRNRRHGSGVRLLLLVSLAVLLLLAAVRLAFHVPKPILVTSAVVFAACALTSGRGARQPRRLAAARVVILLLTWIAVSAALLGTTFYVDRGGWLWYRLTGYNVTLPENLADRIDVGVDTFRARHPMFVPDPSQPAHVMLPGGEHIVDRTVVVPRGTQLTIAPGAVLRFGRGCSLVSYSPIVARGTPASPIVFTARNRVFKWGVVGIVDADSSAFEHVRFEHGRQARVNGIDFTGCLSLVRSGGEIAASRFASLYGRDGVSVRDGDVRIHDNLFEDTFKDGLDLDGGRGEITRNRFVNCGDEGIDVSQNDALQVYDNVVLDRRGGRIGAERRLDEILAHNRRGYPDGR